jgi:1-deoxy-D-xylulose-5-phosphate synthase
MAGGMAKAGLKPVLSIYSTFLQRAIDQAIHDVAILNLPVIFGIDRGGLVEDGETHQGVFDISFMRSIPNMTVLAPRDTKELRNMLYSAVKLNKGPVAIRFPRDKAVSPEEAGKFEMLDYLKWEVISQPEAIQSAPAVIFAYGSMVQIAREALPAVQAAGIDPVIVSARSAKPLDEELLSKFVADPSARIFTLEEGCRAGGFGAAVLEWSSMQRAKAPLAAQAPIVSIALQDQFVEHGNRAKLLDDGGLSAEKVAQFIIDFCRSAQAH